MVMRTMEEIQEYLKTQKKPKYELYDISEIPDISDKSLRASVYSHLRDYLRLPEFLLTDTYVENESILSDIRSLYESYSGDTTICVEYLEDIITEIHPDRYLPIGIVNSISRVLSTMSDNPRIHLVEFVSDNSGYSLLYTTDKCIDRGGIVFRFYNDSTSVYVREYLNINGFIIYLPSRYYNKTSSRYDRYTNDYSLSIDTLVQRVLSEIETPEFTSTLYDHHHSISLSDVLSLEEISNILKTIDDIDVIKSMLGPYEESDRFTDNYSDYLWRCTNIKKSMTTSTVISELSKDSVSDDIRSRSDFREICGSIFMSKKIEDRLFNP